MARNKPFATLLATGNKKAPNLLKVKGFCGPDGEFSLNPNSSQTT